jgi:hypothetical protein
MRYETIPLSIDVEEARRLISERKINLRAKSTQTGVKYYTNAGLHLATLSPAPSSAPGVTQLRYRTAIIGSHHVHARRNESGMQLTRIGSHPFEILI